VYCIEHLLTSVLLSYEVSIKRGYLQFGQELTTAPTRPIDKKRTSSMIMRVWHYALSDGK